MSSLVYEKYDEDTMDENLPTAAMKCVILSIDMK